MCQGFSKKKHFKNTFDGKPYEQLSYKYIPLLNNLGISPEILAFS